MSPEPVMVDKIGPEDTGTYVVTTQGSRHTWNLDESWYIREHVRGDQHYTMTGFRDGDEKHWVTVERWPEVGSTFLTTFTGDIPWHRSSTIRSIEKVA